MAEFLLRDPGRQDLLAVRVPADGLGDLGESGWRQVLQVPCQQGLGVPDGASGTGPGRIAGRCSVSFVAVNAEQAEDWNGASGRHFIEQRERNERMRGRLTARLLAAAQIQDGENVLDIGCGCGDTTILAARATGSGHALGADLSRIQVAEARRLAAAAGVANARFEVADVRSGTAWWRTRRPVA